MELAGRGQAEPLKFLPVAFVCIHIIVLYCIYMHFHATPVLVDEKTHMRGVIETAGFNAIAALLVFCYVKCILVSPGTVPNETAWLRAKEKQEEDPDEKGVVLLESKRSGDARHCKWCTKFKPDRCHHCRVCRVCVLRMDHHCPWIYNCVGFHNHKYFILLVMYALLASVMITFTMFGTLYNITSQTPFLTMLGLLFGETMGILLAILLSVFFGFHVWLTFRAMTTIEFCEKTKFNAAFASPYDCGFLGNITGVLGDNPLLWFLPVNPPSGDGLSFATNGQVVPETNSNRRRTTKGRSSRRGDTPHADRGSGAAMSHEPTGEAAGTIAP